MVEVISGTLKDYAWGVVDGLASWCRPTGSPQAELWFGRHPAGASELVAQPGRTLADLPAHAGMPLVKLLAASAPLSIQVHPDAALAAAGYAQDQHRAPAHRRYSDAAEKSEMLVALTVFDAHAGWRDPAMAADVLQRSGAPEQVVDVVAHGERTEAVRRLLALTGAATEPIERQLIPAAVAAGWTPASVSALARVAATHPKDPGVLVTVLMQHYQLQPGAGLAVPAGVVHSYVDGLALEVMTSSDNVLRLGLTPKPIAIDDALAAIRIDRSPHLLAADTHLAPPDLPFTVTTLTDDRPVELTSAAHHLVLCLAGTCEAAGARAMPGQAIVLAPFDGPATAVAHGRGMLVSSREA